MWVKRKKKHGGLKGETIELDGFPFSKRVFRLPVQHLHRNLAIVLRVPRRHHEPVFMQVDFVDKVFQNGIPHFWIVEVCMKEPSEVRFYRVLVLEERLPDRLSLYVASFRASLRS